MSIEETPITQLIVCEMKGRCEMKKLAEYKSPTTLFSKFTREEVWMNESDNTRYYIGIEGRWVYPLYSWTGTDEYIETSTTIAKVVGENIEPMEVRSIEHVERRIKERCKHE